MGSDWVLLTDASHGLSAHDVCLWDYQPGDTELPANVESGKLCNWFFLLQRKHVGDLRKHFGIIEVKTILKPVTRATLRAFLGEACHRWKQEHLNRHQQGSSIRVERDD